MMLFFCVILFLYFILEIGLDPVWIFSGSRVKIQAFFDRSGFFLDLDFSWIQIQNLV